MRDAVRFRSNLFRGRVRWSRGGLSGPRSGRKGYPPAGTDAICMFREGTSESIAKAGRRLASPSRPRLADDDRGQLLILTGVLLVLGFVVIGTTVVQLRSLEEHTARIERDALLDSVDELVANFNQTIIDSVELGDTNTTDFKSRVALTEARLRDTATRGGLYVSVNLREDPDKTIFWRNARCGAYEPAYVKDGIIIGYDKVTGKETIAGAVYDVHITDGRQSIRMDYYVKVYECMLKEHVSFIDETEATKGGASTDWTPSHLIDGSGAEVREGPWGETWAGDVLASHNADTDGVNWVGEGNINSDGGLTATNNMVSPAGNFLEWYFHSSGNTFQAGDVATDVQVSIDHWHTKLLAEDDIVRLSVEYPAGTPLRSWVLTPGTTEARETFVVGNSPSGNAVWTHQELTNARWTFTVESQGAGWDAGRTYSVDYVRVDFQTSDFIGYQRDVELIWPEIPSPYTSHTLEMTYQYRPSPSTDGSELQIWDYDAGAWQTPAIHTFQNTTTVDPNGWTSWSYALDPDKHRGPDNQPRLRVYDTKLNDKEQTYYQETIYFDFLGMRSQVES